MKRRQIASRITSKLWSNTIATILFTRFPEGYNSEEDFLQQLEVKQNTQLDQILSVLNDKKSAGLIKKVRRKKRSVLTEQQWTDEHRTEKYEDRNKELLPLNHIKNVELKTSKPQSVYPLIAIEEYLFLLEGRPLLFALAKAHSHATNITMPMSSTSTYR